MGKASDARMASGDGSKAAAFDRMKRKVAHSEAVSQAKSEIAGDNVEDRLAALEKEDRIEQLLAELKSEARRVGSMWCGRPRPRALAAHRTRQPESEAT